MKKFIVIFSYFDKLASVVVKAEDEIHALWEAAVFFSVLAEKRQQEGFTIDNPLLWGDFPTIADESEPGSYFYNRAVGDYHIDGGFIPNIYP